MRHQIVKLVLLAAPESDRKDSPALPIGTSALASVGKIGPGPRRDEHRTLTDATVTKTPQNGQSAHVTTGVYVPVDVDQAPLSAAVAISIGAGGTAGQAMAHDGGSPSLLPADGLSTFVSTSACTTTVLVETASLPPGLTLPSPSGDGEARRRSSKIYRAEDMARHGSVYFSVGTRIEPPESRVAANSRFRELIDQVPGINHVRQGGVHFRTVSTFFNPKGLALQGACRHPRRITAGRIITRWDQCTERIARSISKPASTTPATREAQDQHGCAMLLVRYDTVGLVQPRTLVRSLPKVKVSLVPDEL